MDTAIQCNNSGVGFLEQGRFDEALKCFKMAAQLLHQLTQQSNSKYNNVSETTCNLSHKCSTGEHHFIHSAPIVMKNDCKPDSRACTIESCTILYNMALTYHLDATTSAFSPSRRSTSSDTSHNLIQNAIRLYEMAHNLGLYVQTDVRASRVIMSALNNLGSIHNEYGDFEKSRQCFESLSTFIRTLDYPLYQEDAIVRGEFMLNAMIMKRPQGAPAA